MIRTLLLIALLAAPATAAERVTGYVRYQGRTYAVIESKITKAPKVKNDFYGRARVKYAQGQFGKAVGTVKPRTITRTTLVPIR